MATIECCGSVLYYQLAGAGAPVLLLHSSACRGGFWRGLIEHLGEGFASYTPDLAGYGHSRCEHLRGKTTLRDQAEFIAPLLWHDTQPFHLIGHSFGGALALATALAWPDRVKSLTLYEPTAFSLLRGGEDRELYETITRVPARMRLLRDAESPERAIGHFVDFWTGKPVWDERPAAERAQFSRLADKVIDDFRLLFEASFEDLAAIRCPVLVLRGDETVPVAARVAEIVAARIGHARLKTISGAGHMAPVTDPGPIAAAIISHIRTAGTRAGRSEHSAQHELQHGR